MEKELTKEVLSVEEELQESMNDFARAWNDDNAEALSDFFTEDAVRVGFFGEKSRGKKEIAKTLKDVLIKLKNSKVLFEKGEIRELGENYAVWQGGFEIIKEVEPKHIKGYLVQISKKEKDRWLIVEAHPRLVPEDVS